MKLFESGGKIEYKRKSHKSFKLSFWGVDMIAVNVNDHVELYDVGIQVLSRELGPEAAEAFMSLSFGGRGDYTAEKQARPPRTKEQMAAMKARIIEDAKARGLPV